MRRTQLDQIILLAVWAGLLAAAGLAGQEPPGEPPVAAAGLSREQQERFLLAAEILDMRRLDIGVTGSRRATLSNGSFTHDAHVQTVNVYKPRANLGGKVEYGFRDFWGFNVAAYRLDKLLDLNMVPVTVERSVRGKIASVSWWVDDVMMGGREFRRREPEPPDKWYFNAQKFHGFAFQKLIANSDLNLGNFVLDESWKVWMLDFSRAFRRSKKLDAENLTRVGRGFYNRLRDLEAADVERELGPYLKTVELEGLLARRDLLVEHYERLIAERGEKVVLIDLPGF